MKSPLFEFNFPLSAAGCFPDIAADGPGIGLGPLSSHGQMPRVPHAAVRLKVLQPLDVLSDDLAELAFDDAVLLYPVLELVHFVGGYVLGPFIRAYLGLGNGFPAQGRTDTIKIGECHLYFFVIRYVYADKSHADFTREGERFPPRRPILRQAQDGEPCRTGGYL